MAEYARRLPAVHALSVEQIAVSRKSSLSQRQQDEGMRLLGKLSARDRIVLLDERGNGHSSEALAERFRRWQGMGCNIAFLLGGPDGHGAEVRDRADETWSLSEATLPHGLARLLVVEQLYRAWTLVSGHPYHRS